jgi:hypothetical protein
MSAPTTLLFQNVYLNSFLKTESAVKQDLLSLSEEEEWIRAVEYKNCGIREAAEYKKRASGIREAARNTRTAGGMLNCGRNTRTARNSRNRRRKALRAEYKKLAGRITGVRNTRTNITMRILCFQFVCVFLRLLSVCLCVCLSLVPVCLSVCLLFVCLSVSLSVCSYVWFVCLSVSLSVCLSLVCLFVCLCLFCSLSVKWRTKTHKDTDNFLSR